MVIKYYQDNDGNIFANPLSTDGLLEIETAVINGKILPDHKNSDQYSSEIQAINNEKDKLNQIAEAKSLLQSTDWVIAKIYETQLENADLVSGLLTKYADVIADRKQARATINSLEN